MGNQHSSESFEDFVIINGTDSIDNKERAIPSKLQGEDAWYLPESASEYSFSSSDEEDDNEDQELSERLLILEDAQNLKRLAAAFLHPEAPIQVDAESMARPYFHRFSAPLQQSPEEIEHMDMVLDDVFKLKQNAIYYAHPEIGILTFNPFASGRCYYDRYSAIEQESVEDSEVRTAILDDVTKLRQAARWYLHPEDKVETSDSACFGRCYFSRYSAIEQESVEDSEEREKILNDAIALKQLAMDYMHPEVRIVTPDLANCARCYFDRMSAVSRVSLEEAEEHHNVLVDALNLKLLAGKVSTSSATKSITTKVDDSIVTCIEKNSINSASAVQLYGLDDEFVDVSYF